MKFKIKYADEIVGILSLIAIAALIFLIFFIGSNQKWFEKKHPFYTVVNSGSNVSEGMQIQYKGFGIGKVTDISMDENDRVIVKFYINHEHINRVTKGSILHLSVSPIGLGSSLIFYQGVSGEIEKDGALIPEKSSYEGRRRIVGSEVIVTETVDSVASLLASVSDLISNVNTLVKDLANAVEGVPSIPLARTVDSVNKILGQVDALLAGDTSIPLSNVITGLKDVLSNLNSILSDPSGLLPRLVETEETKGSISRLITSVDNTLQNVEQLTGNVNEQISPLFLQVQTLLKQVQDVAEGLKNNPLLKGGVPERMEKESATPKLREENF